MPPTLTIALHLPPVTVNLLTVLILPLALRVQSTAATEESVPDGFGEDDDFDWDDDSFGATSSTIASATSPTTATTSNSKDPYHTLDSDQS